MKHKIGNIIGIILIVILLPIVFFNVTLAVMGTLEPDRVAMVFGYGPVIVETGSMLPEFAPSDLLIVKKADAANLQERDIITFYDANGIVVSHRIIGIDSDENGARLYITKGDANNVEDRDPVSAEQVAGVVLHSIPGGGKVMEVARQPLVMGLVVGVPLALWFGYNALMKALAKRKEKNQKEERSQDDEG